MNITKLDYDSVILRLADDIGKYSVYKELLSTTPRPELTKMMLVQLFIKNIEESSSTTIVAADIRILRDFMIEYDNVGYVTFK